MPKWFWCVHDHKHKPAFGAPCLLWWRRDSKPLSSWGQNRFHVRQKNFPPAGVSSDSVGLLSTESKDNAQQNTTHTHTRTHTHIHTLKRILYTSSCRLLNSRGIAYSAINIWNNMNLFAIIYIHLATCGDLTRLPWTPSLSPVHLPQPELLLASLATNHRYKVRTWTWRPW